ncbi:hypothetical protein [Leptolyngbya sp. NK1-12]|uniref:hypothetical protein n=1 Tax=Leptolyngbya sp. NK1-12 TaxID=2547451 RepID=UPI00292D2622|nr:hypothetical protein [Leptolyngbya sp. NK1-12]
MYYTSDRHQALFIALQLTLLHYKQILRHAKREIYAMTNAQILPATDTWVKATWEDYLQQIEQPGYEKAKGYYLDGWMRIEILPVGSDHAGDHTLIIFAVSLFATLKSIAAKG